MNMGKNFDGFIMELPNNLLIEFFEFFISSITNQQTKNIIIKLKPYTLRATTKSLNLRRRHVIIRRQGTSVRRPINFLSGV